MNAIENRNMKAAIKALGVADRFALRTHGGGKMLHVYLSKAVRQNAELVAKVVALIETSTGRRDLFTPGLFARYHICPTDE